VNSTSKRYSSTNRLTMVVPETLVHASTTLVGGDGNV
jgi:hypothetical protein